MIVGRHSTSKNTTLTYSKDLQLISGAFRNSIKQPPAFEERDYDYAIQPFVDRERNRIIEL